MAHQLVYIQVHKIIVTIIKVTVVATDRFVTTMTFDNQHDSDSDWQCFDSGAS